MVVKVQRPNIIAKVSTDLRIMGELAKTLERRFDWARDLDLAGLVSSSPLAYTKSSTIATKPTI